MSEQLEKIDVEEIMRSIRDDIEKRGYTKKELRFADIRTENEEGIQCLDEYFELDNFRNTIVQMDGKRNVQCWRPLGGNKIKVAIKKIIRKLVKFYVEPIVEEQNQFNFYTVSAMAQIYSKIEEEQNMKIEQMEERIKKLEEQCRKFNSQDEDK